MHERVKGIRAVQANTAAALKVRRHYQSEPPVDLAGNFQAQRDRVYGPIL